MIDWIVEQQGALSLTLVFLIIAERFLTSSIHPKFAYGLWLLVPFVLLCNNAPESLATIPTESFSRYVVSVNPSSLPLETNWLFVGWLFGVVTIIALEQWEYKSHIKNGYRQRISGAFVQLDYRLYPREIKK